MKIVLVATVCLAALLARPGRALAEPAQVTVITAEGANVPAATVAEVQAAVESRVAALATPPAVVSITLDDSGAALEVDGKHRRVGVTDWADPAAARFIVVHVVDLAAPAPPVVALVAEPEPLVVVAAPPSSGLAFEAFAAPSLARGVSAEDPFAPGIEVGATFYRHQLALGASLGWTHGLEQAPGTPTEARYDAWPLRLKLGWRHGRLEVHLNGLFAAYRFSGVNNAVGAHVGGGLAVRWHGRLGEEGLGWFAGAGVDAFAQRVQLTVAERVVYSTPRLAPSVTLGLTWRLP